MDIQSAVDAPRFHHQWKPDYIYLERSNTFDSILYPLSNMGHTTKFRSNMGHVNAIMIDEDNVSTGADRRGDNYGETTKK